MAVWSLSANIRTDLATDTAALAVAAAGTTVAAETTAAEAGVVAPGDSITYR